MYANLYDIFQILITQKTGYRFNSIIAGKNILKINHQNNKIILTIVSNYVILRNDVKVLELCRILHLVVLKPATWGIWNDLLEHQQFRESQRHRGTARRCHFHQNGFQYNFDFYSKVLKKIGEESLGIFEITKHTSGPT